MSHNVRKITPCLASQERGGREGGRAKKAVAEGMTADGRVPVGCESCSDTSSKLSGPNPTLLSPTANLPHVVVTGVVPKRVSNFLRP
jgi:hypothetical protein